MGAAASGLGHGFPFQKSVLGEGSREEVNVMLSTEPGALASIRKNEPFVLTPGGSLPLGSVQFDWASSGPVRFSTPGGVLGLSVSAGFKSGGGVYSRLADAVKAAGLGAGFVAFEESDEEYLVLASGYEAATKLLPTIPIGAIFSVGAEIGGKREGSTAVVRRIAKSTGAATAIADATGQWRLPRQITKASDLEPGTWVAARGNGALSLQLGARAGYKVNFLREAHLLGITRPLNTVVAAALTATASLKLSGDYVILAGRESEAPAIRLRIFSGSEELRSLGVELSVGLELAKTARAGSFVELTLGIHGLQILHDLQALRDWKGETGKLASMPARLDDDTAKKLLSAASGTDAQTQFEAARDQVAQMLALWTTLPASVRAALWSALEGAAGTPTLLPFLQTLATADGSGAAASIAAALAADPNQQSPELAWLASVSELGNILSLLENPAQVQQPAEASANLLSSGMLARLRQFIADQLDLQALKAANGAADFNRLNPWLLARLGDFLDHKIQLADLGGLKLAITDLDQVEPEVTRTAGSAFSQYLHASIAAICRNSAKQSALLDADFNLDEPAAGQAFRDLMDKGSFEAVTTKSIAGVALHRAVLTHEISRSAELALHLPFFDAKRERVTDSVARLQVEEEAGRVLVYELSSKDRASATSRFGSELALLCHLAVKDGKLDTSALDEGTLAYESRQFQRAASAEDFRFRTQTFLREMLGIDQSGEASSGNLGDMALKFQVTLPGSALEGWFRQRTDDERKQTALAVSRALQRGLKELVPRLYLADDFTRLKQDPAIAALLVWSSIPPTTAIRFDGREIEAWDDGHDVYWDWPDVNLRRAVIQDARTIAGLQARMAEAAARWQAAGDAQQASYFAPGQAGVFLQLASSRQGAALLESLLYTESRMVSGAKKALDDLRDCWRNAATAPSQTLHALSEFGADLASTFNSRLTVYTAPEALRTFNSFLLAEGSAAASGSAVIPARKAALLVYFLREGHAFSAKDFLAGAEPPNDQVRFARVFVN